MAGRGKSARKAMRRSVYASGGNKSQTRRVTRFRRGVRKSRNRSFGASW